MYRKTKFLRMSVVNKRQALGVILSSLMQACSVGTPSEHQLNSFKHQ